MSVSFFCWMLRCSLKVDLRGQNRHECVCPIEKHAIADEVRFQLAEGIRQMQNHSIGTSLESGWWRAGMRSPCVRQAGLIIE